MSLVDYSKKAFSTPLQRLHQITETVARHVGDRNRSIRVLEIGCGSGRQLFDLALALPNADLTGVDISAPSIQRAKQDSSGLPCSSRLSFAVADYLDLKSPPFDVIVSYSTLHLIAGDTERLFFKIAGDLVAGGLLVFAMPRRCAGDAALIAIRHALIALRSPLTDAAIFKVGSMLHGHELSEEMLRERVHYMYVLPHRLSGHVMNELLERQCGLQLLEQFDLPRASLAQPQHAMSAFRRKDGAYHQTTRG